MKRIFSRPYRILSDHMAVYQFMLDIYEKDWRNGVPAPFLEYALSSSWMDKSYTHRSQLWFDGDRIVAFCFTESPVTNIYFNLRPGYEELADAMVTHAAQNMPNLGGKRQFLIFGGQKAIQAAATRAGYSQVFSRTDMIYEFDKPLDYPLPEGFSFVDPAQASVEKVTECCWKGFDHEEEEGPWDGDAESNYHILAAPHVTPQYHATIQNEQGEYVCFAGMWWTPQNHLAYMEPLCTVPEYRRRGLAAAALSELYRRMKPLGATHMTGGDNPFYAKIGYKPMIKWTYWKNPKDSQ